MNCHRCKKPVPAWLRELLPPDTDIAWCSGTCMRLDFQAALLDLIKAALPRDQYAELLRSMKPSMPERLDTPQQIREAIITITDGLLSKRLEPRHASTLLYALQTAISSLKLANEQRLVAAETAPEPAPRAAGFAVPAVRQSEHPEPPENRKKGKVSRGPSARPRRRP